jgi:hypothetical protein
MVIVTDSFDKLAEEISLDTEVRAVTLIPTENPDLFKPTLCRRIKVYTLKLPYLEELAEFIMQGYLISEKDPRLTNKITLAGIQDKSNARNKISGWTRAGFILPLDELVINSMAWGNRERKDLPISFNVYQGSGGRILRIEDSGDGFDYMDIHRKLKAREPYFHNTGRGFKMLEEGTHKFAYEGKGNIVNVQVLFPCGIDST